MGKRLIINDITYATNGMRKYCLERETLTEQGYVIQTIATGYRQLANTSTSYRLNYIKNKESIILYPGDTIVFVPNIYMWQYTIYGYVSVNTSNYPSYVATSGAKYVSSASPALRNVRNTLYGGTNTIAPVMLKNTTNNPLYMVIQGRGDLASVNPLSPEMCPRLAYNIYTDDPSNYPEPEPEPEEEESEPETT